VHLGPGRRDRLLAAEGELDLSVEDGEGFLEVVAVRDRAAARRDEYVDAD
jgi:hypothetical protein